MLFLCGNWQLLGMRFDLNALSCDPIARQRVSRPFNLLCQIFITVSWRRCKAFTYRAPSIKLWLLEWLSWSQCFDPIYFILSHSYPVLTVCLLSEQVHRLMLKDAPRTEAYQKAIMGNRALFEGKTVMDIGAGTGNSTNVSSFFFFINFQFARSKPTL